MTTRRTYRPFRAAWFVAVVAAILLLAGPDAAAQAGRSTAAERTLQKRPATTRAKTTARKKPMKRPSRKPAKRPPRKRAPKRPARPARVLAPAVVDSFRTIILTTCPPADTEEVWKGSMREEMARWLAVRYKRAGVTMAGVDCSGFIRTLFRSILALDLPHSAAVQSKMGEPVDTSELSFGDLLFFRNNKRISHAGIYIGNGYFIHSSQTFGVRVDSLFGSPYYTKHYARARRIVTETDAATTE